MNIRSKLAQKHQQTFGKNLTQSVVSIKGMGHMPVITVQYPSLSYCGAVRLVCSDLLFCYTFIFL